MAISQNRQSNEQLIVVLASWLCGEHKLWQEKSGLAAFSRLSRGEGLHASELGDNASAPMRRSLVANVRAERGMRSRSEPVR
jgi:hypothetical protein